MTFAGSFETHVTVAADVGRSSDLLRDAAALRLKCTFIVLERGAHPTQPMFTMHNSGTLADALDASRMIGRALADRRWTVSRVKIEASIDNHDVPDSDEAAAAIEPRLHFEHHVKLVMCASGEVAALAERVEAHGAHVSRNALRARPDGRLERFVTQRCFGVGRVTAGQRFDVLLAAIRAAGHEVADVEREYVVYDTNAALDDGWLGGVSR